MRQIKDLLYRMLIAQCICFALGFYAANCAGQGAVKLEFADKESGEPIFARVFFTKSAKKISRPRKVLFAGHQWLAEKSMQLAPPNGDFEFTIQRGPEFSEIHGGFTIEPRAKDTVPIDVPRSISMRDEKWFSGDHLSSLPLSELQRWQFADAVDMAVSVESKVATSQGPTKATIATKATLETNANGSNVIEAHSAKLNGLGLFSTSRLIQWEHGALAIHGIESTEDANGAKPQGVEAFQVLAEGKNRTEMVAELVRPWSRDVPLLLASDAIRAIQILSSYNRPGGDDRLVMGKGPNKGILGKVLLPNEKDKTPSDVFAPIDQDDMVRFKDARAVGKLSESIYWQMLEAGFKITPTAGSGFDNNDTHVGYNRVYAFSETTPSATSWWQAIYQGRTFVTNGPLLRASINGMPPGSLQTSYRSQSISLDIAVSLSVREPVDYLDVVFNGDTIYSAKLEDHYKRGEFPLIEIDRSGWLVIRVVTEHNKGYRYATTAPFYFVFDSKPRISKKAVSFFQRWQRAAQASLAESPDQLKDYQTWLERSSAFWDSREKDCNAE